MDVKILLINAVFTVFLAALAYLDFKSFGTKEHKDFKSTILSVGILGTFFGIFLGLMGFDTQSIQTSVPLLLDGLKVAFFTTIIAISLAVALQVYQRASQKRSTADVSMDFLLGQLEKLDYLELLQENKKIAAALEESNANNAKFSALYLERSERLNAVLEVNFKETNDNLNKAIKELAKGASEEIITALETVIRDFNNNLNEQFGDNFKELNSAVVRMIDWQENYKESIEEIRKSLQSSIRLLEQSTESFEKIAQRNGEVSRVYDELKNIIQTYKNQVDELNANLTIYASLSKDSKEMFENIKKSHASAMESLQESAKSHNELNKDFTKKITESIDTMGKSVMQANEQTQESIHKTNEETQRTILHLSEVLIQSIEEGTKAGADMVQRFGESLSAHSQELNTQILANTEQIRTHFEESAGAISESFRGVSTECRNIAHYSQEYLKDELATLRGRIEDSANHFKVVFDTIFEQIQKNALDASEGAKDTLAGLGESFSNRLSETLGGIDTHFVKLFDNSVKGISELEESLISLTVELGEKNKESIGVIHKGFDEELGKINTAIATNHAKALEEIKESNKRIALEFLKLLNKSAKEGIAEPARAANELIAHFSKFSNELETYSNTINNTLAEYRENIYKVNDDIRNSASAQIHDNKMLQETLRRSIIDMDKGVDKLSKTLISEYEWFVRRVKELLGA